MKSPVFRQYVREILEALEDAPKTYTQLKSVCLVEATRTRKLKELYDAE